MRYAKPNSISSTERFGIARRRLRAIVRPERDLIRVADINGPPVVVAGLPFGPWPAFKLSLGELCQRSPRLPLSSGAGRPGRVKRKV
jgi:hypothetical protein